MKRFGHLGASLAVAMLVMSGCSNSGDSSASAPATLPAACTYDEQAGDVSVSGTQGQEATIEVAPEAQAPADLVSKDLCTGTGDAATAGSTITVNYTGASLSTGETFDASYGRGALATVPLNRVLPGWRQGLVGLQEGGTRLLVIPPDLAYGEQSPGPGIGPNETLVFVVDLIDVQ